MIRITIEIQDNGAGQVRTNKPIDALVLAHILTTTAASNLQALLTNQSMLVGQGKSTLIPVTEDTGKVSNNGKATDGKTIENA